MEPPEASGTGISSGKNKSRTQTTYPTQTSVDGKTSKADEGAVLPLLHR
jgi:hypothetical protein